MNRLVYKILSFLPAVSRELRRELQEINAKLAHIVMTQAEALTALRNVGDKLNEARTELTGKIDELNARIKELQDAAGNDEGLSQEVADAIEALVQPAQDLANIVQESLPPQP